jgi:hypothetical protein
MCVCLHWMWCNTRFTVSCRRFCHPALQQSLWHVLRYTIYRSECCCPQRIVLRVCSIPLLSTFYAILFSQNKFIVQINVQYFSLRANLPCKSPRDLSTIVAVNVTSNDGSPHLMCSPTTPCTDVPLLGVTMTSICETETLFMERSSIDYIMDRLCDNPPRKIPYYHLNQSTLVIKR